MSARTVKDQLEQAFKHFERAREADAEAAKLWAEIAEVARRRRESRRLDSECES